MTIDVVYLTNDLMFSSRVMSLARAAGISLKVVGSRKALCDHVADASPAVAFVDLEHSDSQIDLLVRELASSGNPPKIVAYGPHVKQSLLDAAQAGGADSVLSRGQFDKQVGSILQALALQNRPESPQDMP